MVDTTGSVVIGKIVRSESHVRYTCQVYGQGEIAEPPEPADYAFGSFVRVPLRAGAARADVTSPPPRADIREDGYGAARLPATRPTGRQEPECWAVGLIYDTILLNPAFGTLGPRLSNDEQVELFSPDYLAERAVLVAILLLGTMTPTRAGLPQVAHGVPPLAPDLGAEVTALPEADVRAFHHFADFAAPGGTRPYLHMGYLPHAVALDNALLPLAMLRTIERLEAMFPENAALLSIVKRNFAWRLKVQSAG